MPQMTSRAYVQKDVIGSTLRKAISGMGRGDIVYGSISILAGHDYWWFLEFGTGAFYETPTRGAGAPGEVTVPLTPPAAVAGKRPERAPYTIKVKARRKNARLVYMTKFGVRRRARAVTHPGIKPLSFVRTSVFEARLELKKELERLVKTRKRRNKFPTRDELVEIVNDALIQLHSRLEIRSPDDEDVDPYHEDDRPRNPPLSKAWTVDLAT